VIRVHFFWPMRAAKPIRSNPDLGRCKTLVVTTGTVARGTSRVGQGDDVAEALRPTAFPIHFRVHCRDGGPPSDVS